MHIYRRKPNCRKDVRAQEIRKQNKIPVWWERHSAQGSEEAGRGKEVGSVQIIQEGGDNGVIETGAQLQLSDVRIRNPAVGPFCPEDKQEPLSS